MRAFDNKNSEFNEFGELKHVVINHNVLNSKELTVDEVIAFAKENSAYFVKSGKEYFILLFGLPGNQKVALLKEEIRLALESYDYGQCKKNCERKDKCHKGDKCQN